MKLKRNLNKYQISKSKLFNKLLPKVANISRIYDTKCTLMVYNSILLELTEVTPLKIHILKYK